MTTLLSSQKEKAKDFKSQIIRYLEAMLQSQQRVSTKKCSLLFTCYFEHMLNSVRLTSSMDSSFPSSRRHYVLITYLLTL